MVGIVAGNSLEDLGLNSLITSKFVHDRIQDLLVEQLEGLPVGQTPVDAFRRTFLSLNAAIAKQKYLKEYEPYSHDSNDLAGGPRDDYAVAAFVLFRKSTLYVANVGDAQVMIIRSDQEYRFLTQKHDPANPEERERIWDAGGWVSRDGNLNDMLKVSRAFGCARLIPVVIAKPHITETILRKEDQLLVIASGELWDFLALEMVASVAVSQRGDLTRAAEKLRDLTIAYGSTESVMVMVISVDDLPLSQFFRCSGRPHRPASNRRQRRDSSESKCTFSKAGRGSVH